MKNRNTVFTTILLVCFGFLPGAQAVVPAPDGGYPGGNTAEGQAALLRLTTGGFNTAVGFLSLRSNATGSFNTAIGAGALLANNGGANGAGNENTASGAGALLSNTTGFGNTANGAFALESNTTGAFNTAIGFHALIGNTSALNTAVGFEAGINNTTGGNNLYIGNFGLDGENNTIRLGTGNGVHTRTFIAAVRGVTTLNNDAIPVLIDSASQLGTMSSSARFKKDIKPMDKVSEAILVLKPVTFHYKNDKTNRPEFGLVAEEVAAVNSNLVVRDKNGEIYTVRYDAVNAMLLNEFLKEHKAFLEQQDKVQKLEAVLDTINKRLKAQDSKIEKVSAQLELSKPALRELSSTISKTGDFLRLDAINKFGIR